MSNDLDDLLIRLRKQSYTRFEEYCDILCANINLFIQFNLLSSALLPHRV